MLQSPGKNRCSEEITPDDEGWNTARMDGRRNFLHLPTVDLRIGLCYIIKTLQA